MNKFINFASFLLFTLFLLFSETAAAQRTKHSSEIIQLPDGTYDSDCSKYIYEFKQRPGFIGGQVRIEKLLLQSLKDVALSQVKNKGILSDVTIRLYADGHTKLIEIDCDKNKLSKKVERAIKRIFLDRKKWTFPVFVGKQKPYIDISIFIAIEYKSIEYDIRSAVDICECGINYGSITIK